MQPVITISNVFLYQITFDVLCQFTIYCNYKYIQSQLWTIEITSKLFKKILSKLQYLINRQQTFWFFAEMVQYWKNKQILLLLILATLTLHVNISAAPLLQKCLKCRIKVFLSIRWSHYCCQYSIQTMHCGKIFEKLSKKYYLLYLIQTCKNILNDFKSERNYFDNIKKTIFLYLNFLEFVWM